MTITYRYRHSQGKHDGLRSYEDISCDAEHGESLNEDNGACKGEVNATRRSDHIGELHVQRDVNQVLLDKLQCVITRCDISRTLTTRALLHRESAVIFDDARDSMKHLNMILLAGVVIVPWVSNSY